MGNKSKKRTQEQRSPLSTPTNDKKAKLDLEALHELEESEAEKLVENMTGQELKSSLKKALKALRTQTDTIDEQDGIIVSLKEEVTKIKIEFADKFLKASCQGCMKPTYAAVLKNVTTTLTADFPESQDTNESDHLTRVENILLKEDGPIPQQVKVRNNKMYITFNDHSDMERAKNILSKSDAEELPCTSFTPLKVKSAAVVLHVDISNMEELRSKITHRNPLISSCIEDIKIIHKKQDETNGHVKLILSSSSARDALLSKGKLFVDNTAYRVVPIDPNREVKRCFNCQRYGHTQQNCRSATPTCGKCAESHRTRDCSSNVLKCANCKANHQTGDRRCPLQMKAVERYVEAMKTTKSA